MDLSQALETVSRSDAGMVRSHNEDSVYLNPALGLAVLADGMGGYNAGEVASGMVTTLLGSELEKAFSRQESHLPENDGQHRAHKLLEQEIARANHAVYQAAQSQPQYAGMGTTLVMALFHDNSVTVAHIGDSRLYRLRGEEFLQITRDHSLLQEQIDSGILTPEQARHSQNKNLVTRAVGVDPSVEAEIRDYATSPGDIYLLCSDGLNDMVEDEEIGMTVQMLSANLELAATQLVQMANDNGGRDNVSVILVRIKREYPAPRGLTGWLGRLLAWFK
jgi:serine/threonine protein phosphatase PrpC